MEVNVSTITVAVKCLTRKRRRSFDNAKFLLQLKTHCAINIDDLMTFEDEKHSITAAELQKDNACRAVTRVSDSNLAESIKDRIPMATRSSTDWSVGVWLD